MKTTTKRNLCLLNMNLRRSFFIAMLGVSIAVKLFFLNKAREIPPVGEALQYYTHGAEISCGKGYHQLSPPTAAAPGYAFFLGSLFSLYPNQVFVDRDHRIILAQKPILLAKVLQVLISTATVYILYLLGKHLFSPRAGLAAGTLCAFDPTSILLTHRLLPETLYTLLFLLSFFFFIFPGRRLAPRVFLSGLLLGFTAMIRSISLGCFLLFFVFLFFMVKKPQEGTEKPFSGFALLFITGVLLPILPWTIRNYLQYRQFILVDTTAGYNLWLGNHSRDSGELKFYAGHPDNPFQGNRDPRGVENAYRKKALDFIRKDPQIFFKNAATRLAAFFGLESFLLKDILNGTYGPLSFLLQRIFCLAFWIPFVVFMVFAIFGITASRWNNIKFLILGIVLLHTLVNVVFHSYSYYRAPILPFAFLYGGLFLANSSRILEVVFRGKRFFITVPFHLLLLHFRGAFEDLYRARALILALILLAAFSFSLYKSMDPLCEEKMIQALWFGEGKEDGKTGRRGSSESLAPLPGGKNFREPEGLLLGSKRSLSYAPALPFAVSLSTRWPTGNANETKPTLNGNP